MEKISEGEIKTGFSVLIVDDNPKNLQVAGSFLHEEGYNVEFAMNGITALEWIDQRNFDLILLDIMMPEMDGFEVCKHIKSDPGKRHIPIIFLTAKTETKSIVKGFEMGAVDYVSKPFNKNELLARISTQLTIKKTREESDHYLKELEQKNKLITFSIKYAQHLQNAVLNTNENISEKLPEYFYLFKPKDIVGGDFYWSFSLGDLQLIALMDCTGHGVPGALMSMLGLTLLNETVKKEQIIQPNEILNRLRDKIIDALGSKRVTHEVRDGMDAVIILLDFQNYTLQFSGANNPLYLVRNHELIKYKGDRMPVAYYERMTGFTNHKILLRKGDMIYLFSDGFTGQFGGKEGKRFKSDSFRKLLMDIHQRTMKEQHEILSQTFEDWKGNLEQIDDVTVLGIRIK